MLLILLLSACETPTTPVSSLISAYGPEATAGADDSGTEEDDGGTTDGGTTDSADTAPPAVSYDGPSYGPCVSDAECEPGDACTTVVGYTGFYCAPPCDPAGDGAECQLEGLDFETTCTAYGRCAQSCELGDDTCPPERACQQVEEEQALCAGEEAGGAGPYGTCTHPQAEGTDCPEESSCFGGDLLGVETGVCLPWCEDYTCPDPPAGVSAYPYCYDIGLGFPTCALLCDVETGTCPEGQFCFDSGYGIGACLPEGTDIDITDIF